MRKRQRDNFPYLFLFPSVLILLALTIYPILYAFNLSFYKWAVTSGVPAIFVGLANYADLMNSPEFFNAFTNSLLFTGTSVGLSFVTGLMVALILNSEIKGVQIYQSFLMVPTIITPIVVGMSFRFLYNFDIGLINYFLEVIHLPRQAWLGTPSLALPALVMVDVWEWTPFMALVLLAGLQSLPRNPFEAADIDGASSVQKLRYITLPLLGPAIAVAALIRTMDAFRWFDTIYAMTRGGPGDATETLSVFAWKYGFLYFDMGYATAAALIMLFVIELFCWAYMRFSFKPAE